MPTTTLHGVYLSLFDSGVLITGESGIGKSELALGLITRGHHFISDDIVVLERMDAYLLGSAPPELQDYLEIRGIGILNIPIMFGDTSMAKTMRLDLIIALENFENSAPYEQDRLHGVHSEQEILGVCVPQVTIPVAPGRNLAVLAECAVKQHLLKIKGYDAAKEFIAHHQQFLQK